MSHALIIEDELLLAFSDREALGQLGYSTFSIATSIAQAIEAAERKCPDLIVADHRITDGTGTEAVQATCSDKAISVVFVTGSEPEVRAHLPDALNRLRILTSRQLSLPRWPALFGACPRNSASSAQRRRGNSCYWSMMILP